MKKNTTKSYIFVCQKIYIQGVFFPFLGISLFVVKATKPLNLLTKIQKKRFFPVNIIYQECYQFIMKLMSNVHVHVAKSLNMLTNNTGNVILFWNQSLILILDSRSWIIRIDWKLHLNSNVKILRYKSWDLSEKQTTFCPLVEHSTDR